MKLPPVVYVEWVDAVANVGWSKDSPPLQHGPAVGFLVKETKDAITLAVTVMGDEHNASMTIPKAWIKRRRKVALPARAK